jgi:cell division protein FtsW
MQTLNWVHERTGKAAASSAPAGDASASVRQAETTAPVLPGIGQPGVAVEQPIDWLLLSVTVIIVGFGATMVYSSSTVIAAAKFDGPMFFMTRQVIRALIGCGLLAGACWLPLESARKYSRYVLIAALLFLLVPAMLSVATKGAKSWVHLLGVTFQPSEFVKLTLIFYLADRLSQHQERLASLKDGVLPHVAMLCVPLGLIVLEPDVGTAVAMASVFGVMMFAANVRIRHLLLLLASAAAVVVILILIEPYRMKRIEAGYQIKQGLVAFGSGGISGRGLGRSLQKFFFLPEPYTDSIFPIIGEEFGFIGTVSIIVLFLVFAWRGLRIAYQQPSLFRFLLATGLTANILMYALLNMLVVTAIIPATGLPLPFISYGGSSLILNLASVGFLLNMSGTRRLDDSEREVKEDTE